jgi:hypothetical protein
MAGGIGGLQEAAGWGSEADVRPHPVVAIAPERHHPLKLALSCPSLRGLQALMGRRHGISSESL